MDKDSSQIIEVAITMNNSHHPGASPPSSPGNGNESENVNNVDTNMMSMSINMEQKQINDEPTSTSINRAEVHVVKNNKNSFYLKPENFTSTRTFTRTSTRKQSSNEGQKDECKSEEDTETDEEDDEDDDDDDDGEGDGGEGEDGIENDNDIKEVMNSKSQYDKSSVEKEEENQDTEEEILDITRTTSTSTSNSNCSTSSRSSSRNSISDDLTLHLSTTKMITTKATMTKATAKATTKSNNGRRNPTSAINKYIKDNYGDESDDEEEDEDDEDDEEEDKDNEDGEEVENEEEDEEEEDEEEEDEEEDKGEINETGNENEIDDAESFHNENKVNNEEVENDEDKLSNRKGKQLSLREELENYTKKEENDKGNDDNDNNDDGIKEDDDGSMMSNPKDEQMDASLDKGTFGITRSARGRSRGRGSNIQMTNKRKVIHRSKKKEIKKEIRRGVSKLTKVCPYCNETKSVYGYLNHKRFCQTVYESKMGKGGERGKVEKSDPIQKKKKRKKRGRKKSITTTTAVEESIQNDESNDIVQRKDDQKTQSPNMRRSSKRAKLLTEKAETKTANVDESKIKLSNTPIKQMDKNHSSKECPSIDSCIILHAAIHNPLKVLNDGPGVWMMERFYNELKLKPDFTEDDIIIKWQDMMFSMHQSNDKNRNPNSCQHLIKDVLTVCFASKSAEAQSVALLSSGWTFIPIERSHRSRAKTGAPAIYKNGKWGKDGNQMPLQEAWDEYITTICDEIDEGFEVVKEEYIETTKRKQNSCPQSKGKTKSTNEAKGALEKASEEVQIYRTQERPASLQSISRPILTHDEMPKNSMVVYRQRRSYVKKNDPRPTFYCTWCGPKLPPEEVIKEETICKACMFAYEGGWRYEREPYFSCGKIMHINKYLDPNGKESRSVKLFLENSSNLVVQKLCKQSQEDQNKDTPNEKKKKDDVVKELKKEIEKCIDTDEGSNNNIKSKAHTPDFVAEAKQIALPIIEELVMYKGGLGGTLRDDKLCFLNLCYGSDVAIAFRVLQPLIMGDSVPHPVTSESPFPRHKDANSSKSNVQSQYYGVIKVDINKNEFAVEFPMLVIEKRTEAPFQLPTCCTSSGKQVMLRTNIDNEYLAGQFYAYIIRVLYGAEGVNAAHQTYTSKEKII